MHHNSTHALSDMRDSLSAVRLWYNLGLRDLSLEHARARIGLLWPLLGALAWIAIIFVFLGDALGRGRDDYLLYLTLGIIAYNFASGILVNGVTSFIRFKTVILNIPNPLFVYPLRVLTKVSYGTALQLVFIPFAVAITGARPEWSWLLALPAVVIYLVTGAFLTSLMGIVGVFIGDLRFAMQPVMRMLMFATPIFWYPTGDGIRATVTQFNPLAHYIAIFRDPFLGGHYPLDSLLITMCITTFVAAISLLALHHLRNEMVRSF